MLQKQVVTQNVKHRVCLCKMLGIWSSDPAVLLLGIYVNEAKLYVSTKICTQVFIAVFIISQREKSPDSHPLVNGQTKCGISIQWNIVQP